MRIDVSCKSPKYACGHHAFASLEELLRWFHKVKSVSSSDKSRFIFAIAKDGELRLAKHGLHLDIEFDSANYVLANKIAAKIGLITRDGIMEEDEDKATAFARIYDSRMK